MSNARRDQTEEHDFGPHAPRPIVQTAEGFKVESKIQGGEVVSDMVERVRYLVWSYFRGDMDKTFECVDAVIALLAPHYRNEGKEAAAKLIEEKARIAALGDNTARTTRRAVNYNIAAAAIRASKEPT